MNQPTPRQGTDAALLVYLLADTVAPAHGIVPMSNADVPGREAKTNRQDIAKHLFAVAFWSLREQGAIDLALTEGKVLFIKTTHVQATLKQQVPAAGLEGSILALLGKKPSQSVSEIIRAWYRRDVLDPWGDATAFIQSEGVQQGYFLDAHRGVVGALTGKPRVLPNLETITPKLPEAEALVGKWQAFQSAEPDLATRLLKECASAIQSRLEQSDNN